VVAHRLADGSDGPAADRNGLARDAVRLASLEHASLARLLGLAWHRDAVWLVEQRVRGAPLGRLLPMVRFSAQQAAYIAEQVEAALSALHAAGLAHGGLAADCVHIGADGGVRISGWAVRNLRPNGHAPGAPEGTADPRQADLAAAAALRAALADAAWRPPGTADAPPEPALTEPQQAGAQATPSRGGDEADRWAPVRGQLAALVAQVPPGAAAPRARTRGTAPLPAAGSAVAAPYGRRAALRAVWARTWVLIATVTVLAAAVGLEFVLLHGAVSRDLRQLTGHGTASATSPTSASPSAGAARSPSAGPAPYPSASGIVTGLQARALKGCAAGGSCTLGTLFALRPQDAPVPVRWSFLVVDACTGARTELPGGSVSVPAGNGEHYEVSSVRLPQGRALAVFPVTSEPAQVAGPPVPVPADGGSC
jgi:hypothetical protein